MKRIERTAVPIGLALIILIASCTCSDITETDAEIAYGENTIAVLQPSEPEPEPEESEPEIVYEEPADGIVNGVDILTYDEALQAAKEAVIDRETSFSINTEVLDKDVNTILTDIYNSIIAPTGAPTEGDYIYMSIRDINLSEMKTLYSGARPYARYDFTVQYYSSKEQEDMAGQRINDILTEYNVYSLVSDIDKVSVIYEWIVENVAYDTEHAGDENYPNQYSAYGALFDGTAVCQGCCSLMYRMLLTAGIDCRCIIGFANNETHAWNIVNVDGVWYDTDVTWDLGKLPGSYNYFLKGSDAFDETHFRDEMFMTEEFYSAYPVSPTDYQY